MTPAEPERVWPCPQTHGPCISYIPKPPWRNAVALTLLPFLKPDTRLLQACWCGPPGQRCARRGSHLGRSRLFGAHHLSGGVRVGLHGTRRIRCPVAGKPLAIFSFHACLLCCFVQRLPRYCAAYRTRRPQMLLPISLQGDLPSPCL